MPLARARRFAAPVLLVLLVVMMAMGIERYAAPAGGLQLPVPQFEEGKHVFVAGKDSYPRELKDADEIRVRIARPARRIASQYWSIDEFVYSIVPPRDVVAVSASAYEPTVSNVLPFVRRYKPVIATDPERVLKVDPDLILVSSEGRSDFTSLIRSAGIPVFRTQVTFETLAEIEASIRLMGYLTGADRKAQSVADSFHSTIERLRSRRPTDMAPPRVLGLGGRYSYGSKTIFNDIIHTLGGVNVSAEGGLKGYSAFNYEQAIGWNPEWIFAGAAPQQTGQVLDQLLKDPSIALTDAARSGHIVVLDNNVFLPMSPYTALLATAIADALYPAASKGVSQ